MDGLPANEAAEGVISFLASRPHSWKNWRVECRRSFDANSQLIDQALHIELQTLDGSFRSQVTNGPLLSPSAAVQSILSCDFLPSRSALAKWKSQLLRMGIETSLEAALNSQNKKGFIVFESCEFEHERHRKIFLKKQ